MKPLDPETAKNPAVLSYIQRSLEIAEASQLKGNYRHAASIYEQVLALLPGHKACLYQLGTALSLSSSLALLPFLPSSSIFLSFSLHPSPSLFYFLFLTFRPFSILLCIILTISGMIYMTAKKFDLAMKYWLEGNKKYPDDVEFNYR